MSERLFTEAGFPPHSIRAKLAKMEAGDTKFEGTVHHYSSEGFNAIQEAGQEGHDQCNYLVLGVVRKQITEEQALCLLAQIASLEAQLLLPTTILPEQHRSQTANDLNAMARANKLLQKLGEFPTEDVIEDSRQISSGIDIDLARRTLVLDFDGVIHCYSRGWYNGLAYDKPVEGAIESIKSLIEAGYKIVVLTSQTPLGEVRNDSIRKWLKQWGLDLEVTNIKPMALCYIDDRNLRFTNWADICQYFI